MIKCYSNENYPILRIEGHRWFGLFVKPGMLEDVLEGRSVARPILEATEDEVFALGWEPSRCPEVDHGAYDLVILFERDVTAHHVVEEDAQWPHRRRPTMISPVSNPFRRGVNSSTYSTNLKNTLHSPDVCSSM